MHRYNKTNEQKFVLVIVTHTLFSLYKAYTGGTITITTRYLAATLYINMYLT